MRRRVLPSDDVKRATGVTIRATSPLLVEVLVRDHVVVLHHGAGGGVINSQLCSGKERVGCGNRNSVECVLNATPEKGVLCIHLCGNFNQRQSGSPPLCSGHLVEVERMTEARVR